MDWDFLNKHRIQAGFFASTVIQLHPPKSQWISNHPGCLHLWRCTDGREFPLPPALMVGIKEWGEIPV